MAERLSGVRIAEETIRRVIFDETGCQLQQSVLTALMNYFDARDATQTTGVGLIATERARQMEQEGWTPAHDATHVDGTLAQAAVAYASTAYGQVWERKLPEAHEVGWPWDFYDWKPSTDPVRNLVKAGALIAAEIDRLQQRRVPDAPE